MKVNLDKYIRLICSSEIFTLNIGMPKESEVKHFIKGEVSYINNNVFSIFGIYVNNNDEIKVYAFTSTFNNISKETLKLQSIFVNTKQLSYVEVYDISRSQGTYILDCDDENILILYKNSEGNSGATFEIYKYENMDKFFTKEEQNMYMISRNI